MKRKTVTLPLIVFLSIGLLTACAGQPMQKPAPLVAQPIAGQWVPKVDHLYFIVDGSSSMTEAYGGQAKFDTAKAMVSHFNQTMPDLPVQTTLRGFGFSPALSNRSTTLFFGPQAYSRSGLSDGLNAFREAGGPSPLAKALAAAGADLDASKGPVAMVIISDGKSMGADELSAAKALAARLTGRLCLYTILVGDDPDGRTLLEKIAAASGCGTSTTADSLVAGADMAAFVRQVLLASQVDSDGDGVPDERDRCPGTPRGVPVDPSGCPLDSDGDGVYDYLDKCPGTPRGTAVDATGCPIPVATRSAEVTAAGTWIYKGILFEINKSVIKPSSFPILDEIVDGLKSQPTIKVEIQGHTDNTGTAAYNQGLSERRADAVRQYLMDKGIAAERLDAKGYGLTQPIATNSTTEGRARNRRVELKPIQ